MKFGTLPLEQMVGKILAHQCVDAGGRRLFSKGHVITTDDLARLRAENIDSLVVVALDDDDVNENEAARRVGVAAAGQNIRVTTPGVGRANLIATVRGILRMNVPALERLNNIDEGITLAVLREHTLVQAGQLVGLVKIIPYAMPIARVEDAEAIAREADTVLSVRPLVPRSVSLIVTGPPSMQAKLVQDFASAVQSRVDALGSQLKATAYVAHEEIALAEILRVQAAAYDVILVAGVSATIDRHDVIPSALRLAGGSVAHFGVPVDPGSLLMLGYIGKVAVIGAPGCIKSPKVNVIDLILPRLFAGERLTRADLVALGHGGLLEDIEDRAMPRQL